MLGIPSILKINYNMTNNGFPLIYLILICSFQKLNSYLCENKFERVFFQIHTKAFNKFSKQKITSFKLILICIPLTISIVTTRDISLSNFGFVITALIFIFGLTTLFLIGIKCSFIYYIINFSYGIFIILYLGKFWEYWLF